MVKLNIYKCDRRGKEFKLESGREPNIIKTTEEGFSEDVETSQVCVDCHISFYYWMNNVKESDKLFDEIARKEIGE